MSRRQMFDLGLLLAFCGAAAAYVAGFSPAAVVAVGLSVMASWGISDRLS